MSTISILPVPAHGATPERETALGRLEPNVAHEIAFLPLVRHLASPGRRMVDRGSVEEFATDEERLFGPVRMAGVPDLC